MGCPSDVVGVGGAYRIVIDLYGGESDVLEFVMGTDLGNNRLNQVAVAVGSGVNEGEVLNVKPMQIPSPVTALLAEGTISTNER